MLPALIIILSHRSTTARSNQNILNWVCLAPIVIQNSFVGSDPNLLGNRGGYLEMNFYIKLSNVLPN